MENKTFSPCPYCDGRNENCADCELQSFRAIGTVEELAANMEMFAAYRHVCGGRPPEEIAVLVKARDEGPCGLCRYKPPSSCDGKPCTMCPAEAAQREEGQDTKSAPSAAQDTTTP